MKSIGNYISESIYGNLGLTDEIYKKDTDKFKSMTSHNDFWDVSLSGNSIKAVTEAPVMFWINKPREKFDVIDSVNCFYANSKRASTVYRFYIDKTVKNPGYILDKFVFPESTNVELVIGKDITLDKDFFDVATFEDGKPSLAVTYNGSSLVVLNLSKITTPIKNLVIEGNIKVKFNKNLHVDNLIITNTDSYHYACIDSLPQVDILTLKNHKGYEKPKEYGSAMYHKFDNYQGGDVKKLQFDGSYCDEMKKELTYRICFR